MPCRSIFGLLERATYEPIGVRLQQAASGSGPPRAGCSRCNYNESVSPSPQSLLCIPCVNRYGYREHRGERAMKTIALVSAFAAGLSPVFLLAQAPRVV